MTPEQKVQIVQQISQSGRICAMVGDGANDAAAIRAAAVGWACPRMEAVRPAAPPTSGRRCWNHAPRSSSAPSPRPSSRCRLGRTGHERLGRGPT
uniref:HAD family hydrolase n=1 Tax=Mycobacterium saskatchewanense TaxID=220927 RepID=UPI000A16225D|nr:HAD family hydrolase [Mycobacterium saskatchewanense]